MMKTRKPHTKAGLSRKKRMLADICRSRYIYIMTLPGVIALILFSYMPIYGILIAFKDFSFRKGILSSPWTGMNGFGYFAGLFREPEFWNATRNTVLISIGRILIEFPIPIILAILMNELSVKKFKRTVQSVLYFPNFISWVIIGSMVFSIFSVNNGVINNLLSRITGTRINFLVDSTFFIVLLFFTSIWKGSGYGMIIYLAAITNIDNELYEAATIDGCGRFKRMWHVTLPGISVIIVTMLILAVGNMMNAGFDQIFNLYNSMVYDVADIIDTYVYRLGMRQLFYSQATAVGLFKSVINFMLLLGVNYVCKHINGTGIYM